MAPNFSLSFFEPHPSVKSEGSSTSSGTGNRRSSHTLLSGRGGAGNYTTHKTSELTHGASATGPASRFSSVSSNSTSTSTSSSSSSSRRKFFTSGIGGAGNVRPTSERRVFDFEEEIDRMATASSSKDRFQVGRGGAGNTFRTEPDAPILEKGVKQITSTKGKAREDTASVSSSGSVRSLDSVVGAVKKVFDR